MSQAGIRESDMEQGDMGLGRRRKERHGPRRTFSAHASALALAALIFSACGETIVDPPTPGEFEAFEGTWDAEVFEVTSDADTTIVADLLVFGFFTFNVQPSGTYTATLTYAGVPVVEIGQLAVSGNSLIMRPNGGDPSTSTFVFLQPDYLQLDGPTDFDFNVDGTLTPAQAHIEIRRR